jgi:hypothetical protein
VISQLEQAVSNGLSNLPQTVNTIAWALTIVLVWLAITQLGLLMQGLEMVGVEVEADEMES